MQTRESVGWYNLEMRATQFNSKSEGSDRKGLDCCVCAVAVVFLFFFGDEVDGSGVDGSVGDDGSSFLLFLFSGYDIGGPKETISTAVLLFYVT